jgi:hypothetical protein
VTSNTSSTTHFKRFNYITKMKHAILILSIVVLSVHRYIGVESFASIQVIDTTRYESISTSTLLHISSNDIIDNSELSRRNMISTVVGIASSVIISTQFQQPSYAAAGQQGITAEDKERIKKGYENLVYLLNNFEQETTVCRENGGECKRDADAIRRALGLRSTTDPFFQIDKVFAKAKYMDIDIDKLETLFEATEDWNSAISMSNSMAFISQFGEYNPGGGKDTVLKYLNESEKQVKSAKAALEKIMDSLDISKG